MSARDERERAVSIGYAEKRYGWPRANWGTPNGCCSNLRDKAKHSVDAKGSDRHVSEQPGSWWIVLVVDDICVWEGREDLLQRRCCPCDLYLTLNRSSIARI